MPRPSVRNIEIEKEQFLKGADVTKIERPAKKKVIRAIKEKVPEEQQSEDIKEAEKKWATKLHISTIELIEKRFHQYYVATGVRLSKRELVEKSLLQVLRDDVAMTRLFGKPPTE